MVSNKRTRTRTRSPKSIATKTESIINSIDEKPLTVYKSEKLEESVASDSLPRDSTSDPDSLTQDSSLDNGLELLGRSIKKLVQGVQQLRHLGIEDFVLPLPKIVAVGDQSAGKSSLIEGISGIKVPREAGCCTRCPVEINLTESAQSEGPWTCRAFLSKKYIFEGAHRSIGATRARPLGPWTSQDAEDQHFITTYDRNAVQEILYWAQLAILNPSNNHDNYIPGQNSETPDTMQVKFSPNVVRLDISGPDLPNLSFYDLPGVINVAEIENERYLIKLVKNLVKDYIKADDCINLLALPMSNDPANSTAAGIIMEMKAQIRTIGVLTKPDRVQDGESLDQWTSILNGDKLQLGLGYHVVKNNPNPTIDHTTARIQEMEFFQTTEPYASQFEEYKTRFGTLQLQTALSHHLTQQIRRSLPHIKTQIEKKSAMVTAEVNALPKALAGNFSIVIERCISLLSQKLQIHIEGGSPEHPFVKDWLKVAYEFRKEIADSRPVLQMPSTRVTRQTSEDAFPLKVSDTPTPTKKIAGFISIDDSDDAKPINLTPPRKRHNASSNNNTPQKRGKSDIVPLDKSKSGNSKVFSLEDIRRFIQAGYHSLPGSIDPRVIERMSRMSMEHWESIMMRFLDKTKELCRCLVKQLIDESFQNWRQSPLHDEVTKISNTFLSEAVTHQQLAIKRSLSLELHKPMTLDAQAIEQAYEKALESLKTARRINRATSLLSQQEEASGKTSIGQARQDKLNKITDATLGPDPFSQEIRVMSRVNGYYEWAFTKFVDNVSQSFRNEWFLQIRDDLPEALTRHLGIESDDASERCALLLAVDPYVEQQRIQLKKEQATLLKAQNHLLKLDQDIQQDEGSEDAIV